MFTKSSLALLAPLFSLVLASPTLVELNSRASIDTSSHCGQWDTVTAGSYSLLLDQWGASGATSGSQCANLISLSGSTLSWKTTWTWTGGSGVKSFTNVQLNQGINKQLSAISSMPASDIISDSICQVTDVLVDDVAVVPSYFWYRRC
jgi:xyloglucan-specific endo-beta-1,4-glucanase